MQQEPTMRDLMVRMDKMTNDVKSMENGLKGQIKQLDEKIDKIDQKLDRRFDDLTEVVHDFASDTERRLSYVERKMVTKDHLDKALQRNFVVGHS